MKSFRLALFLTFIYLLGAFPAMAQIDFGNLEEEQIYRKENKYNTWSITLGGGPIIYYVDVIDYTFIPSSNLKFAPTIMISKQFNRPWGIDAQFLMANMYGQKNDRYYSGDLIEGTINLTLNVNQLAIFGPINDKWNIYTKLGIGVVAFRSRQQALVADSYANLAKDDYLQVKHVYPYVSGYPNPYGWGQDDYLAIGYNRTGGLPVKKESRQKEVVVPFGIGVKHRISKSFDVGMEFMLHAMNNDNLDVNMTGADNDSYMFASLGLTYKIGKKDKRHASWTYKDFNFSYKRQREKDPLAQKLDSLKRELEFLAANDSVVSDTTMITTETVIYEEDMFASVFFDLDKSNISTYTQKTLAKVARTMKAMPDVRVMVMGYCDERGADEYNVKLSQRRIDAVVDVLVKDFGIDRSRFETNPKGEAELLSDTKELKPRGLHMVNRRVDIMTIKK
jgi:outer membrane protein OmpA-like peptidoglycan-associated protein